jgi:hypothetical protein
MNNLRLQSGIDTRPLGESTMTTPPRMTAVGHCDVVPIVLNIGH